MKKLMFIAAAIAGVFVANAAIESQNCVGYNVFPLRNGATMTGSAFFTVNENGAKLSEIIPGGYLNNSAWTDEDEGEGCNGYIICQVLTAQGKVATDKYGNKMEYSWIHLWTKKNGWKASKYWLQSGADDEEYVIGDDIEVVLDKGQGLWFKVTQDFNAGMNVTYAGEALLQAGTVPLRNGATPVVVPVSKDTLLSQVMPKGYLENPAWTDEDEGEGCNGYIICQFLTAQGRVDTDKDNNRMEYSWIHLWTKKNGWKASKYWLQSGADDEEYVIGDDIDVTVPMGYGLWIKVTQDFNNGMYVEGPGIEDEVEE